MIIESEIGPNCITFYQTVVPGRATVCHFMIVVLQNCPAQASFGCFKLIKAMVFKAE